MHTGGVTRVRYLALLALLALLVLFWPSETTAQALPAPSWVRSAEVVATGATIRSGPSTSSARRGTVRVGTRLPMRGRVMGEGCPGGEWAHIGDEAFICETLVRYSRAAPRGDDVNALVDGALMPRTYAFVRTDGTWAYSRPEDYFHDDFTESLGRGFGLAIVERRAVRGVPMARTLSGLWVPTSELRFVRPSDFVGVALDAGRPLGSVAWVVRENAPLRERPGGRVLGRASRLMTLRVVEVRGPWLELEDGRFIAARDVARPSLSTSPSEVTGEARWIDIDLGSQTLVAYVGARPVYATLVSTGRAGSPTRRGVFRVWVKLAEDDMDDLERNDVTENYAIQAIPWVQYFDGGIALHAAFWHDRFGRTRSAGCVNLAPRDARYLFEFTGPSLPSGWDAILPTERSPGTLIRVR